MINKTGFYFRRILALAVLLPAALVCYGQAKQIYLQKSDLARGLGDSKEVYRVIKPVFEHEGSVLIADSADFNKTLNTFDAFGNVNITQPNGTLIYSDLLNYNGNTRIAVLTNNVRLIDPKGAVLTTNLLTYNMATKIGTYVNGGKIVNQGDVLTSKNGYYFDSTSDAYFRYNVEIKTADALVKADTMRYNSISRVAWFYGPTNIYSKKDTLYTELGDYNTETRRAHGMKNNLYKQDTKFLKGDSLFYDDLKGVGIASRNVVFADTGAQKILMYGQKGTYSRLDTSAMLTIHPYVVFLVEDSTKTDSVFMTADTLFTKLIERRHFKRLDLSQLILQANQSTEQVMSDADQMRKLRATKAALALETAPAKPQKKKKKKKGEPDPVVQAPKPDSSQTSMDALKGGIMLRKVKSATQVKDSLRRDSLRLDSIKFSGDTTRTRIVEAYHHVKIFKSDLQSTSDSVFYSYQDSVIRSYRDPVVWSQGTQMSADTIYMQLKDKKLDRMLFQRNGFIISAESDSVDFNQVKGRTLIGYFKDSKLKRMYVNGNAESLYFNRDSLKKTTGMNHSEGSVTRITFENNEVDNVAQLGKNTNEFSPIEKVEEKKLKGFDWRPDARPKSREEIIPTLAPEKPAVKKPMPAAKKPAVKRPPPKKP